ncbi:MULTISPECIES: hypothetical protein [Actinomycetes]
MSTMPGLGEAEDWSADAPHRKLWKLLLGVLLLLVAVGVVIGAAAQYAGDTSSGFAAGDPLGVYLIGMLLGGFLFVVVPAVVAAWLIWSWRRGL